MRLREAIDSKAKVGLIGLSLMVFSLAKLEIRDAMIGAFYVITCPLPSRIRRRMLCILYIVVNEERSKMMKDILTFRR